MAELGVALWLSGYTVTSWPDVGISWLAYGLQGLIPSLGGEKPRIWGYKGHEAGSMKAVEGSTLMPKRGRIRLGLGSSGYQVMG